MDKQEKRAVSALAAIFAFRMLGLFMILPVFSLYADSLTGATPFLIGLTLGIYGFTQACLQMPFGILSDRFGRKPMIAIGLVIFTLGSIIAALSTSIEGVIIGRALQGAGAIGSVTIALIADLTYDENRTKAMGMVGMTIGLAFTLAMLLGPTLNSHIGVNGIFWLTAGLALFGLLLLFWRVPTPIKQPFQRDAEAVPALFKKLLTNTELLRLDLGIFILHAVLTAIFIVVPVALQNLAGLSLQSQPYLYLPVLLLAFIAMLPMIIIGEKRRKLRGIFITNVLLLLVSVLLLILVDSNIWMTGVALFLFFTAFIVLEASLPSLVSKIAPAGSKGTAIGIYSTTQFLGIFVGGSIGGYLYGQHHLNGVFWLCAGLLLFWLIIAMRMKSPPYLATYSLNIATIAASQRLNLGEKLLQQAGVAQAFINPEDDVAYLKIDTQVANKQQLKTLIEQYR